MSEKPPRFPLVCIVGPNTLNLFNLDPYPESWSKFGSGSRVMFSSLNAMSFPLGAPNMRDDLAGLAKTIFSDDSSV